MKKIILYLFIIVNLLLPRMIYALDKNLVNIYFFHSDDCPHCKDESKLLDSLEEKYENIKIYRYEISSSNNLNLMHKAASLYNDNNNYIPYTIIGNKIFKGYSHENSKANFIAAIEFYSNNGYKDLIGEYLNNKMLPTYPIDDDNQNNIDEYIDEKTDIKINIPIIGEISTKNMALPLVTIIIGLIDGFNPCAMWILLFLISMLIGMNDRKKMVILGFCFIFTSSFVYLLFMLTWLNAAKFLSSISILRFLIGVIAIIASGINLYSFFKTKNGCNVVDDKKRNKIFDKIKTIVAEKHFYLSVIGIVILAISVNIIELACSAGLPVMWSTIISLNNVTKIEEFLYIILYIICFMLDDLIVFLVAVISKRVTAISTKFGKISKLIGGLLLLIIGILLIFAPELLQLNF